MAFKPSSRKKRDRAEPEADMLPIMGLIIILIPMLLSSAQFSRLGMIELNLPKAAGGGGGGGNPDEPKEIKLKLNMMVTILKDGYVMGSAFSVATESGEPTIPLKAGEYDYEALNKYLYDIKTKAEEAEGDYVDLQAMTLVAEKDIFYKEIINVMDNSRIFKEGEEKHILFPSISIAAGLL